MKECKKCRENKPISEFRERKSIGGAGSYFIGECRKCELAAAREYRLRNIDKCKKRLSEWKRNNKEINAAHSRKSYANRREKCYETSRLWVEKNRDRYLAYLSDYGKKQAENLTDSYLRTNFFRNVPVESDVLDMKRAQLQLLRETKKLLKAIKEKQNA